MTPADPLLDYGQAARYLGDVSIRTIQREVARGRLAYVTIRRTRRFRQSELDRYLEASERRAAS